MPIRPTLTALLLSLPAHAAAQTDAAKLDIMALSLEQLLTVQVASQSEESIKHAPAIVSTYLADELRELGLRDLKDFIDFVPGVRVNRTSASYYPIEIRGLWDTHNQKVLFLVDGVPSWSSAHADVPLMGVPLAAIEKIEVMRGPSAVIYGTNASAGVINIITKRDQNNLEATAGEHQLINAGGTGAFALGSELNLSMAFELQQEQGFDAEVDNAFSPFDPTCQCFPSDSNGDLNLKEEKWALHSRLSHRQFTLAAMAYQSQISGSGDGSLLAPQIRTEHGLLIGLNYQKTFQGGTWKLYSDWDKSSAHQDVKNANLTLGLPGDGEYSFDHHGDGNYRWRSGAQLNYAFNAQLSLLSGLEYEHRTTENRRFINYEGLQALEALGFVLQQDGSILLIEENANHEKSAFSELQFALENFTLKAGFRHVINSEYGSKTLPRLSAVQSLSRHQSLKFVYATGFNSPTFRQNAATDQFGLPLSSSVSAELIESADFAYTLTTDHHHLVLNMFWMQLEDGIVKHAGKFINGEAIQQKGVELDYQLRAGPLKLFTGASYLASPETKQAQSTGTLTTFASNWQLDTGLSYGFNSQLIGVSLRASDARKNAEAYYWLNASYQTTFKPWQFSLSVENLLSDGLPFPDVRSGNDIVIQGADKQRLSARVKYSFY